MAWIIAAGILIHSAILSWALARIVDLEKQLMLQAMDVNFFRRKWLKKGCRK